ncbi:hypothetical protein H5T57_01700 [Candidatus Bipolaricaulota bacterium]|nr:hypothetical protein [Candidatus Bipolaricaulota bacterium]
MSFDAAEELLKALLGVRDGKLLQDRPIRASDPNKVALTTYIHPRRHECGVSSVHLLNRWEKLIQAISSTEQSHNLFWPASSR